MSIEHEPFHFATIPGADIAADPFLPPILKEHVGPLIHAIAHKKAVLYVGAGASIPAGLPSWEEFLRRCLERSKNEPGADFNRWEFTDELINKHRDFLAAAELLQMGLGNQLERYIWDEFGQATVPSPVHHALARIPASIVVTVNYDRLLETVYSERPNVWTWRDPDAFFSAIRNGRFAIIKTHGDVGNAPSLVLTRTQYRDLMHQNEAFNACFRTLLSHNTFLFVGTSLRDPDLMQQLDTAKLSLGTEFGPHYAILFDNEVDDYFAEYLKTAYNIHVILCDRKSANESWCPEKRCRAVVRLLTEIGGLAASKLAHNLPSPPLDETTFCRLVACRQLIATAVRLTGAFRGDLCLIDSDGQFRSVRSIAEAPEQRRKGVCDSQLMWPSSNPAEEPISHHSIIGGLFLRQKVNADFIYLSNVRDAKELLKNQGFAGIEYVDCHPDVQCELAVPIFCDGQRVGVLNLESEIPDAFTRDHLSVARRIARCAGWIYYEARQRQQAARVLESYFADIGKLKAIMDKSRLLKHYKMEYILWRIDYDLGVVTAHSTKSTQAKSKGEFRYRFDKQSLATHVLRERHDKIIPDAQQDQLLPEGKRILAEEGVTEFNIHGPISGTPVQRNGTTCAVLVTWSDKYVQAAEKERAAIRKSFPLYHERVKRLSQLLANDPGLQGEWSQLNAVKFIERVDEVLAEFDRGNDEWWFDKHRNLTAANQHMIVQKMLDVLTDPCTGLQRSRLWLHAKNGDDHAFRLVGWHTTEQAKSHDVSGQSLGALAQQIAVTADDPYVEYTKARFKNDPYARHQHRAMFDRPDSNSNALHKDLNGMWIVGPIALGRGKPKGLIGYVSADNQTPVPISDSVDVTAEQVVLNNQGKRCVMRDKQDVPREVQAFQRSVIDVITDLLASVIDKRFPIEGLVVQQVEKRKRGAK